MFSSTKSGYERIKLNFPSNKVVENLGKIYFAPKLTLSNFSAKKIIKVSPDFYLRFSMKKSLNKVYCRLVEL